MSTGRVLFRTKITVSQSKGLSARFGRVFLDRKKTDTMHSTTGTSLHYSRLTPFGETLTATRHVETDFILFSVPTSTFPISSCTIWPQGNGLITAQYRLLGIKTAMQVERRLFNALCVSSFLIPPSIITNGCCFQRRTLLDQPR